MGKTKIPFCRAQKEADVGGAAANVEMSLGPREVMREAVWTSAGPDV